MRIIQLTPENSASVAGLMKKVFDSYDWTCMEMVFHHGPYLRKNKRLPKISADTSKANFSLARVSTNYCGIVIDAQITIQPRDMMGFWIHFGETIIFNDKKIFVLRNSLGGRRKDFCALVPTHDLENDVEWERLYKIIKASTNRYITERGRQLDATRH